MQGRSVATSADDQCTFSPDFVNHHIFDPHTGRSPTELSSVTVVASNCVLADALTKVFFMAGYDQALPLARKWGVDVLVVDKRGRWQASPGVALRQT
jgi:thiamine biosynthesis lipoprotein